MSRNPMPSAADSMRWRWSLAAYASAVGDRLNGRSPRGEWEVRRAAASRDRFHGHHKRGAVAGCPEVEEPNPGIVGPDRDVVPRAGAGHALAAWRLRVHRERAPARSNWTRLGRPAGDSVEARVRIRGSTAVGRGYVCCGWSRPCDSADQYAPTRPRTGAGLTGGHLAHPSSSRSLRPVSRLVTT